MMLSQLQAENHALQLRIAELEAKVAAASVREAKLREIIFHYRIAFDNAVIGMALVTPDGHWLDVNASLCALLGYTAAEFRETTFHALTHPDDRDIHIPYEQQLLAKTIASYQLEKRYIHKQGHVIWTLLSVSIVWDLNGQPLYFISQIQDITSRKQAEAALRESEARVRTVLASSDSGIVFQLADGTVQESNASAARILGLSYEQLRDLTSVDPRWQTIHEDGSRFPNEMFPTLVTQRTGQPCTNVVMGIQSPEATLTWIRISTQPLFRQGEAVPYAVVISFTDITEHKLLEEELREREEQYESLMNYSLDAVLLTAPDGRIFAANPAATALFGYTEAELCAGGRDLILDPHDPQLIAMLAERARIGSVRGELMHKRHDGSTFSGELSSALFRNRHGQLRTSLIIRDISARKQAEQALRESEDRFAKIFHASPVGICITTVADGRYIDVNPSCEQLLGYTREELLQHSTIALKLWKNPEDRAEAVHQIRTQGRYRNWGTQFVTKSGHVRSGLISLERITLQGEQCILTSVYDITEWRELEVERELLIAQLHETLKRTDALYVLTAMISNSHGLDVILRTVVERAAEALPADRTVLITIDMQAKETTGQIEAGSGALHGAQLTFAELWEGLSGVVLREGQPVLSLKGSPDQRESPRIQERRVQDQVGSVIVVPVRTQQVMVGTLTAINAPDHPDFTADDMALLGALANQAAIAIEQVTLLVELQHRATIDELTHLLNRRAWLERSQQLIAIAQRSLRPVSVILLDADHFKRVNDTYGHAVGDGVLQAISHCCQQQVRAGDLIGRYGGEEFVVLLPDTDQAVACIVAERLRNSMAAQSIVIAEHVLTITVSLGITTMQGNDCDLTTMLTYADQALYAAKQAGRNTIRSVDVPPR